MKTEKLEPCPVCRWDCLVSPSDEENPEGGVVCLLSCGYGLMSTNVDIRLAIDRHNTLSRCSETGRLVEEVVGDDSVAKVWIEDGTCYARGYIPEGLGYTEVTEESPTLLDALRAVAAKIFDAEEAKR